MRQTVSKLAATCALLASLAAAARGEPDGGEGIAPFAARASHRVAEVTSDNPDRPDPREGWAEHARSLQFGPYRMRIVQRIDPETGMPPRQRRWGDVFVGLHGYRPYRYASANWSPWTFLIAEVRLAGHNETLSPTLEGLCQTVAIRYEDGGRIVAEAIWRDRQGGWLQARLIGRAQWNDRFGLALRYTPPEGREVESVRYRLTGQPFDYSDRGLWERRRWITTPRRDLPVPAQGGEAISLALPEEFQAVFHNRFAQTTAGMTLAVDPETVERVTVESGGQTVHVFVTPKAHDTWTTMLAGDWVDRHWQHVAARFMDDPAAILEQLRGLDPERVSAPEPVASGHHRDIDRLLERHPALAEHHAGPVSALRRRLAEAPPRPQTPAEWIEVDTARHELEALYQTIRSQWIAERLWREEN